MTNGAVITTTDYSGNYIYRNNALQFISQPEGYLELDGQGGYDYTYQYKDHLGNIRLSYKDISTTSIPVLQILEENNYYPFGLKHSGYNMLVFSANLALKYKYNGKELNDELGLDWYDYGARFYDPSLGRWNAVDPLASQFPSHSPYNFCLNNPVRLVDPDGRAPGNPSTDVKRNEDGSYTVVGAKNDGDRNIYVVGENGKRTGEVVGSTVTPFDFMSTNEKTGGFHFDPAETGVTFSMDKLTVSGTVQVIENSSASINSADASELASWGSGLFLQEYMKTSGSTYAGLTLLKKMSQNGGPLDFKVSLGLHPYTPIKVGESNMITTLRGMGNMIFGMNITHTIPMMNWMGNENFYSGVMNKVGAYNQSQNHGNGYNAGWPFYGEHTYSGTYIYFGYFGKMP